MKLVTIPLTQLQEISIKKTNSFNGQTSSFRKQTFTCSNSTKQTLAKDI